MRRTLLKAALVAGLLVLPLWAQGHRGGASFSAAHAGFASRSSSFSSRGAIFTSAPRSSIRIRTFPPPFSSRFHRRRFFAGYPYWYGYGGYYPGYYYPFYDSYSSYDYSNSYGYDQNQQLSAEVNRLSDEVARLREESEARAYAPPVPPVPPVPPQASAKPQPHTPTALVFLDGHKEEADNYAVVGQTLWVFNEHRARKLPLADLDIAATQKLNDDRGVDFTLPRQR